MIEATSTELRKQAKHYFDLVQAGQTVRVSRNGVPIADIGPVAAAVPSWKQLRSDPLRVPGAEIASLIAQDRDCWPAAPT
jgi:antitoxin (DNA-binding transcriptional repressor) of toxin-antitoxin stability system